MLLFVKQYFLSFSWDIITLCRQITWWREKPTGPPQYGSWWTIKQARTVRCTGQSSRQGGFSSSISYHLLSMTSILGLTGVIPVSSCWERNPENLQKRPNVLVKMIHKISRSPTRIQTFQKLGLVKSNSTGLYLRQSICCWIERKLGTLSLSLYHRTASELATRCERIHSNSTVSQNIFKEEAEDLVLLGHPRDGAETTCNIM